MLDDIPRNSIRFKPTHMSAQAAKKCRIRSVGYLCGGRLHQLQASLSGKKVELPRTAWLQLLQEQAVNGLKIPHPGKQHISMVLHCNPREYQKLFTARKPHILSLSDRQANKGYINVFSLTTPTGVRYPPTAQRPPHSCSNSSITLLLYNIINCKIGIMCQHLTVMLTLAWVSVNCESLLNRK